MLGHVGLLGDRPPAALGYPSSSHPTTSNIILLIETKSTRIFSRVASVMVFRSQVREAMTNVLMQRARDRLSLFFDTERGTYLGSL